MSYFLIYGTEDGIRIKQFANNYQTAEYLEQNFNDCPVEFLDYIPSDMNELYDRQMIVIKGEVVKPKPVTVVKTFEIN